MSTSAIEIVTSDKYKQQAEEIEMAIKQQYLNDEIPWVLCFSGGKDSTALLQLVFYSLISIPNKMAGELGFEPSLADPESAVLPLDDSPAPRIIHRNVVSGKPVRKFGSSVDWMTRRASQYAK